MKINWIFDTLSLYEVKDVAFGMFAKRLLDDDRNIIVKYKKRKRSSRR